MLKFAWPLAFLCLSLPVLAEDTSPWFGGENTDAFRITLDHTQSISEAKVPVAASPDRCEDTNCPQPSVFAKAAPKMEAP
jgi:hypothetical protein